MEYLAENELDKLSARSLPIEDGDGRTAESAYVLKGVQKLEAPSVETLIIDLVLKASGFLSWNLDKQLFSVHAGREMDRLEVTAIKNGEQKEVVFYFDLSQLE